MQTSNWIALGALVISAVALWRTEWGRASDRRTSVRKEEAALRLALDELLKKIRLGLQSRQRITAMTGQAGNLATFTGEVAADTQELERLRARLALATSSAAQDAAVTIHEVRARGAARPEVCSRLGRGWGSARTLLRRDDCSSQQERAESRHVAQVILTFSAAHVARMSVRRVDSAPAARLVTSRPRTVKQTL